MKSYTKSLTWYLINRLQEFDEILNSGAAGDKNKHIRFWSQKVTGRRHSETTHGQISILGCTLKPPECTNVFQWNYQDYQVLITRSTWHWCHFQGHGLKDQGHNQSINKFISCHSTEARATVQLCRIKEKCLKTDLKCVNGWSSSTVQWRRVPKSQSSNRKTTSNSVQVVRRNWQKLLSGCSQQTRLTVWADQISEVDNRHLPKMHFSSGGMPTDSSLSPN